MKAEKYGKLWHVIGEFGSLQVFVLFAILIFLFNQSWFFLPFFLMIVISTAITYSIKWVFPTPRPDHKQRPIPKKLTLWNYWRHIDRGSFPSAHAVRTAGFAAITFFYHSLALQAFAVLLFFVVSSSRVLHKRHHWKDIVGGALIGIAIGVGSWYLSPIVSPLFVCKGCMAWTFG